MKKTKRIIVTSIAFCFLALLSCNDEFTTNPQPNAEDLGSFFTDEANVDAAVIGIYDLLQHTNASNWNSAFLVKLLPGDASNCAGGNKDDQPQLQDIDDYVNVTSSNASIASVWDLYYRTIALSNLVITNVQDSNLSNSVDAMAQAKFFRAYSYFELTTMFGDIPLTLEVPSGVEDFNTPKSSRADVYAQIEADLTDAIAGLQDKSAVEAFRVSKGAAQALMGKVMVFQGKYGPAIPYFESVINNPSHDLEPNVADVWSVDSEFGIESLLEIGYVSTEQIDWGNINWGGRIDSNIHIQLMGPRGDGIFDVTGTGLLNGWGFNLPTAKIVNAFDAAGDTERKAATLLTEAELIAGGGGVDQTKATGGAVWDYEGAIRVKYGSKAEDTSEGGVRELNYSTNYRLIRYAEVLLLAAEAYNKNSQDGLARTQINKVRNRAGLADLDATLAGDALFDALVNEKFLELAHEGQRFWDLVRWGRAATELAGTGYSSKNDLFPIPLTEIDKNGALSQEDQNPGY